MVTVPDSRCFIGMKQRVSWPWTTLFHPDSRCFMAMKQCFILIQGVSWPCFILIQHVSRCFTTMKQIHDHETNIAESSWINMFHHCFIALIHPVSCWFNLFHHCFITVSSMFHQWERALTPLHRSGIFGRSRPAGAGFPMSLLLHAKPVQVHYVCGPGPMWHRSSMHLQAILQVCCVSCNRDAILLSNTT